MEKETFEFFEEWLPLEKYHFKILTVITILADNQRAYRGTLKQFCAELNIGTSSVNQQKICGALTYLAEKEYVQLIKDDNIYTVSLAKAAEKSKNIIKIKKAWYTLIREYHTNKNNDCPTAWESILQVFLLLLELKDNQIYTYKELGEKLNISESTVSRCIRALKKIDFKDFAIDVQVVKEKAADGSFRTQGTTYNQFIKFE